ncbi:hypothetical protein G9A89_021401 [Geosiphon pyriformis]|nr:hypothetical protein G9A89_021401 [Geosiphon pyriformis]
MPPSSFNPNRLKVQLKLSINRLKLMQQKKASIGKHARKEIAELLKNGKIESAKIRVEGIIREDFHLEAMEILELYCELLLARFGIIEQMKQCDSGVQEAVNTLIYAAPRSEIKELNSVRDQLIAKYGKDFAVNAIDNKDNCVNDRIVQKFKVSTPDVYLVNRYLEEIAKSYNVDWTPDLSSENLFDLDLLGDTTLSGNGDVHKPESYTALPAFDLLFEEANNYNVTAASGSKTKSSSTIDHKSLDVKNSELLPDVPLMPPSDKKPNKLGKPPSPIIRSKESLKDDLPPPYTLENTKDEQVEQIIIKNDELPDFEELAKRFEALKRKK